MKTLLSKVSSLIFIAGLSGSAGNFSFAQLPQICGTDAVMTERMKDPDVQKAREELEAFTKEYVRTHKPVVSERGAPVYIIPVVFHVIHDNGPENIPVSTVTAAINLLNKDYQKLNSDSSQVIPQFKHLIADADIEFRLAQKDPDGNCTNGIDRVFSYRTYQGNDRSKVVIWDRRNYLNIWTVYQMATPGVLAYAYLPPGAAGLGYKVDGVIVWYTHVSSDQTLTHEIGHTLNLQHTWGGGEVGTACGDDGVSDTPITEGLLTNPNCPGNKIDFSCDKDSLKKTFQFDSVTTTSGPIEPYPTYVLNPNTPDTALTLLNAKAVGLGASANSAVASAFAFPGWDAGAVTDDDTFSRHTGTINTGKYYELTVRPQLGQGMSFTGIRFWVKRSPTGPRMFSVRSSETVNFGSNLTGSVFPLNPQLTVPSPTSGIFYFAHDTSVLVKEGRITLSGTPYTQTDDTVIFRFYAWNAEDTLGTFEIDSVAVLATFGTIENYDNHMDYTGCANMFTIGQAERMHAALNSSVSSRNNLWTPANHALTGIDNPQTCAPEADFYTVKTMACQNTGSVQFFDNSQRGPVTTRTWTFPNGNPATSSAQNPIVTFSDLWSQSVTLTVSNSAGSSSITKNMVWVAPPWPDYAGIFFEDFEDPSRFNSMYRVDNRSGNASVWQVTNSGTFPSGTHGLKLNAFSPIVLSTNTTPQVVLDWGIGAYDKDGFVTPSFDLSHVASGTGKLEFKLSGATRSSTLADITDNLKVWYSTNCGNTWLPALALATYTGAALSNAGSWQVAYVPSTLTQWVQKSINLPQAALAPNVRFKFEYVSGDFSNDIYIDDINISGTVGIEEDNTDISADMVVYPNPAAEDVSITYRLSAGRNVKLQVYDAIGNLVYDLVNQKQPAGSYSVTFNTSRISNGIYQVKLSGDNVNLRTEKIVIIR